jgi:uncharacterized protein
METVARAYRLDRADRERVAARIGTILGARTDVLLALIFGSFVDGEAFHDLDLAIWTAGTAGARLDVDLAASLSREFGFPVDVRRLNDAPVSFRFNALRGRAVVVRDERLLADLMERTAREYHDRAALLRRSTAEAFGR